MGQLAWSPDGAWLLVSWPAADERVFVHVAGERRPLASSRIAEQFGAGTRLPHVSFLTLDGWCCTASGSAG
jgi:hypothetical protein